MYAHTAVLRALLSIQSGLWTPSFTRASPTYRSHGAWVNFQGSRGQVEENGGQGRGQHRHGVADIAWSQKGRRSWSGGSRWIHGFTIHQKRENFPWILSTPMIYVQCSIQEVFLPGRAGTDDLVCFLLRAFIQPCPQSPSGLIIGVPIPTLPWTFPSSP